MLLLRLGRLLALFQFIYWTHTFAEFTMLVREHRFGPWLSSSFDVWLFSRLASSFAGLIGFVFGFPLKKVFG